MPGLWLRVLKLTGEAGSGLPEGFEVHHQISAEAGAIQAGWPPEVLLRAVATPTHLHLAGLGDDQPSELSAIALIKLHLPALSLQAQQFAAVCAANPDAVLELAADGRLIPMTPTGVDTGAPNNGA